MPLSPRVRQPALDVMKEHRLTIAAVAYAIGLEDSKGRLRLRNALSGFSYPTIEMMEGVAKFLRRPVDELFHEDKIQHAYGSTPKLSAQS